MPNILKEVRILQQEGKLHSRLVNRMRMLLGISLILVIIVFFNIFFRGTSALIAIPLMAVGFVLGMYVFSRMMSVTWDEEKEVIASGRMDMLGWASLALYILFEVGLRTEVERTFPITGTVLVLATIGGTLLGRAIGTVIEIHRVYVRTHS